MKMGIVVILDLSVSAICQRALTRVFRIGGRSLIPIRLGGVCGRGERRETDGTAKS